jgi:Caspase domain
MRLASFVLFLACALSPVPGVAQPLPWSGFDTESIFSKCNGGGHWEAVSGTEADSEKVSLRYFDDNGALKFEYKITKSDAQAAIKYLDYHLQFAGGKGKPPRNACVQAARDQLLLVEIATQFSTRDHAVARVTQPPAEPAKVVVPEEIAEQLRGRGHALLIGVSNYTSGWDNLPSVKDDVLHLEEALSPYFQTVVSLLDPTVDQLRDRIRDFLLGRWNTFDARLFIYYSGHGFTDLNRYSRQTNGYITGSNTPVYHESDLMAGLRAVSFSEVHGWSLESHARHVLMVFDSCFSGSLFQTKSAERDPQPKTREDVLRMLQFPVRYYITAGRRSQMVAANSTFANVFLRGIRGEADLLHDGIISADELGLYLSREVPRVSQGSQTPQFNSIDPYGEEGKFFFLPEPRKAAAN